MTYVGHLGASLVYEQGAGVSMPSEDCEGFWLHLNIKIKNKCIGYY